MNCNEAKKALTKMNNNGTVLILKVRMQFYRVKYAVYHVFMVSSIFFWMIHGPDRIIRGYKR